MADETEKQVRDVIVDINERLGINSNSPQMRQHIAAAISGGYDAADTLHCVYLDYGYPATLTFSNFWNMYRRFGIAKNAVNKFPDTCWRSAPTVEGLGNDFDTLVDEYDFWKRMKELDTRQRVGRYAGLFMRVRDGLNPEQPLTGKLNGLASLVEMIPLYEGQLTVLTTDQDKTSLRFGMPLTYQYSTGGVGDRNERESSSMTIHWTRLVMAAEGSDGNSIYGVPALEAGYNSLLDLRKIVGAGGEGFYRNAAQSIAFDVKDSASAMQNKELLDGFNEQFDDFTRNRMRRGIWTPGMEATPLDSSLVSPKEFFNAALNDVAASIPMPATILIGQQTGRLASDEDMDTWLLECQSRRVNWCTPMTSDVIDWCIEWGVLKSQSYTVEWDDLLAISDGEKLDNADKMAATNQKNFMSGGGQVFSEEEIRDAAGMEDIDAVPEEDLDMPTESDDVEAD